MNALALTDYDWQIQAELRRLADDLDSEDSALTAARMALAVYERGIRERFAEELAAIEAIQAEVGAELAKQHQRQAAMQETLRRAQQQFHGQPEEPPAAPIKPARGRSRKAKKLYLAIALRCHPDKTDDPDLHELFRHAQDAERVCDVEVLQQILDDVKTRARFVRSASDRQKARLMAKRKALAAQLEATREQRQTLENSQLYRAMLDIQASRKARGDEVTDAEIRAGLQLTRTQFQARLDAMRRPPPTVMQWQVFATSATSGTGARWAR